MTTNTVCRHCQVSTGVQTAPAENGCTIQSCLRLEEREQLEQLSGWLMDSQPFRPGRWIACLSCSVSGSSLSRTWSLASLPSPPAPSSLPQLLTLFLPLSLSVFSVIKAYFNVVLLFTIVLGYPFSIFKCFLVLEKKSMSILLLLFVVCHPQSIFPMILISCYRQSFQANL